MIQKEFTHVSDEAAYEKALLKFDKMLATEQGKKYFAHLVFAFIHKKYYLVNTYPDDPQKLFFKCSLTNKKLVAEKEGKMFQSAYRANLNKFTREPEETDEQFENRLKAYEGALISSNPYAVNCDWGYKSKKSNQILCIEAINALQDKLAEVNNGDDEELKKMVAKPEWMKKKAPKKIPQKLSKLSSSGTTLGDLEAFKKLKSTGKWK